MADTDNKHQEQFAKRVKKLTKHKYIRATDRGNSAIFTAMCIAKKLNPKPHFLIPDQGGWISYKKYPHFFNFNVKEIKTDYGIVDLGDLKEHTKNASAFIVTSFAGYFAEQPMKKIAKICHKNNCLLIEDVSGALGDSKLCNGKYSDMILASFGKWKPINNNYGGFISTNKPEFFDKASEALSMIKVHPSFYKEILPLIKKDIVKKMIERAEKVKKDLKKFDLLHKDKRGINVIVKFDPDVIEYCQNKGYPYILCPNYIRVNEKAISIELKRLDYEKE